MKIKYVLAIIMITAFSAKSPVVRAESLEDAWTTALSADYRLKAAQMQTESAKQQVAAAKAQRLPDLRLEGGYTVMDNAPVAVVDFSIPGLALDGFPLTEDNSFAYQATTRLPLFTSGRISRAIDAAGAGLKATRADETRTVENLKLDVAEAYVRVLQARRANEVAADNVKSLSSHASNIQNFFDKGLVARNDLLAAQVALADAQQNELKAKNIREITQSAYNRLLGRPMGTPVVLDDLAAIPECGEDIQTLTEKALENRQELEILNQNSLALQNQAAMIRAAVLPQVAIQGGYGFQENKYQVHEGIWSAMIGVEWHIFDKGISRHRSAGLLNQSMAQMNLRNDLSSKIRLAVRQIWFDINETKKRIAVTKTAVSRSEENLNVSKDRYRKGLGINTEVLDAETLRTKSYTNYNNAIYDNILAMLRMRHAVGEL